MLVSRPDLARRLRVNTGRLRTLDYRLKTVHTAQNALREERMHLQGE